MSPRSKERRKASVLYAPWNGSSIKLPLFACRFSQMCPEILKRNSKFKSYFLRLGSEKGKSPFTKSVFVPCYDKGMNCHEAILLDGFALYALPSPLPHRSVLFVSTLRVNSRQGHVTRRSFPWSLKRKRSRLTRVWWFTFSAFLNTPAGNLWKIEIVWHATRSNLS